MLRRMEQQKAAGASSAPGAASSAPGAAGSAEDVAAKQAALLAQASQARQRRTLLAWGGCAGGWWLSQEYSLCSPLVVPRHISQQSVSMSRTVLPPYCLLYRRLRA